MTQLLLQDEVPPREAIIRVLEQAGIDMVFGIPGGNTGALFNALYDHQSTIQDCPCSGGVTRRCHGRGLWSPDRQAWRGDWSSRLSTACQPGCCGSLYVEFADAAVD